MIYDDEYRRLMDEREIMRQELDRAWREVDAIALERDKMIRERDSAAVDLEEAGQYPDGNPNAAMMRQSEQTEMNKDAPKHVVGGPFAWLVQSTTERNPPHGWAVHMFKGQHMRDAVAVYLQSEVDRLRDERDTHARWRQDMADTLGECERARDALGLALNKVTAIGEMLAAVVQDAKDEFVRVPYGASHEDVAAINDWHKMAGEALAEWENKT